MGIVYVVKEVTPAMAKKWLGLNENNYRAPKGSKIPNYARDMIAGRWRSDTGQHIKFTGTAQNPGRLIDGQNRLFAVVLAEIPVKMEIAYGVPEDAVPVLDTGAARTAADVLGNSGVKERMRASAIVRWICMWEAKAYTGKSRGLNPTHSEILERYYASPGIFNAATSRATDCQIRELGTGAPVGTAFALFAAIDVEEAHAFFDQFITGADLPNTSPVLVLRNRMIRYRAERMTRPEQLAFFIKAWNFYRAGETIQKLQLPNGDLTNFNFPQPK